jgi:hypothetical protein
LDSRKKAWIQEKKLGFKKKVLDSRKKAWIQEKRLEFKKKGLDSSKKAWIQEKRLERLDFKHFEEKIAISHN